MQRQTLTQVLPSEFNSEGLLPAGDYVVSIEQLTCGMFVIAPNNRSATWDESWRRHLVGNLSVLVEQLWQAGVTQIFVDGSFVEDKDHPNDIDGYFVCDMKRFVSGDLERDLNLIDPHKCWTWDPAHRRPFSGYPKRQLPMWHAYRVELYPHFGQLSGIQDKYGNELEFPSAFRLSRRDGRPRGILQIIRGSL